MNTHAANLAGLRWQHRLIAVFAPEASRADRARAQLERAGDLADRDVAWFVVYDDDVVSNIDTSPSARELQKLHRGQGFEAVLVGKDGSVKARQDQALDVAAFNAKIDTMPMRQREMRTRDRR